MSVKNSSDTIGNRIGDLPACSAVPRTCKGCPNPTTVCVRNIDITLTLLSSIKTGKPDDFVYNPAQQSGLGCRQRQIAFCQASRQSPDTDGHILGHNVKITSNLKLAGRLRIYGSAPPHALITWRFTSTPECTNLRRQVAVATKYYTAVPNPVYSRI
jgi:hypothetical protein